MLRSIIGDLDKAKFTDERLKKILVVGAYNVNNDPLGIKFDPIAFCCEY